MDANEIVSKIKSLHIPHPRYVATQNAIHAHVTLGLEGSVILLAGPTRVGKSSLIKSVMPLAFPRRGWAANTLPYITVLASPTDRGFMSTRYLLLEMLKAIQHPFYEGGLPPTRHRTETEMNVHLKPAFAQRQTRVVVVDEAQHLLRTRDRRAVAGALDTLKCIGNDSGTIILLVGGYELLTACFESSHLNGRLTVVNFPRYTPAAEDAANFDRILCTFDDRLAFAGRASLFGMRDLIYDGSLGSCGLVSGWTVAAVSRMHAQGERRLSRKHFQATRFVEQMTAIRAEIEFGESFLSKFRANDPPIPQVPVAGAKKRGRRRPGRRNPTRDPIGSGVE